MQETNIEATKIVHFKFLVTVNLTVLSSFSSKSRVFFELDSMQREQMCASDVSRTHSLCIPR